MKIFGLAIGAIHGLIVVGALAILEALVQAFRPAWELPFSIWWGMLFCLPGIAFALLAARFDR